jgi:hypothetical protein
MAITHDEKFYHLADKLYKMEWAISHKCNFRTKKKRSGKLIYGEDQGAL